MSTINSASQDESIGLCFFFADKMHLLTPEAFHPLSEARFSHQEH